MPAGCFSLTLPPVSAPSADDLSSQDQFEVPEAGGWDATLSGEDEDDFFDLQIVKHYDGEVNAVVLEKLPCQTYINALSAN